MALDLQQIDSVLKTYYTGAVRTFFNDNTPLLTLLREAPGLREGKVGLVYDGHCLLIADDDPEVVLGAPPPRRTFSWDIETDSARKVYARVQISAEEIANTRANPGAFVQALAAETEAIQAATQREFNRALYWDGWNEEAGGEE